MQSEKEKHMDAGGKKAVGGIVERAKSAGRGAASVRRKRANGGKRKEERR